MTNLLTPAKAFTQTLSGLLLAATLSSAALAQDMLSPGTGPKHAIAMHGEPKMPEGFGQFPFVYEAANQGGELVLAESQPFDSLNPFIVKGITWGRVNHLTFESLLFRSPDEPFTLYGLLAEFVEVPEDRSWVEFTLNPAAEFSDGSPVTVEDVIFSMETLRDQGRPNHRTFYSLIDRAEQTGPRSVRFVFNEKSNFEMPLIMGHMAVFSKAFFETREFNKTTLEPVMGSGPYTIEEVDAGRSLRFVRNRDYWGDLLGVNKGRNNFEEIKIEYYRDENSNFEGFKKGLNLFRFEYNPTRWAKGYDFPGTRNALVLKDSFEHSRPSGMLGLAMNTRRAKFSDVRVREALIYPLDFEWMNENFYSGAYVRTQSFFDNSELSSRHAIDWREEQLLAKFPGAVDADIYENGWTAPVNGNRQNARNNAKRALDLLGEAGWHIVDGVLKNDVTGEAFSFEILLSGTSMQKVAQNYATSLKRIGITCTVRVVDDTQYQLRRKNFDFDMIPWRWWGTLSPGNEQANRWGTGAADAPGSGNVAGVKSPAVDALIEDIVAARTREELVAATRALDRTLLSGYYAVPLYHQEADMISWWGELQMPRTTPLQGWAYRFGLSNWWMTSDN